MPTAGLWDVVLTRDCTARFSLVGAGGGGGARDVRVAGGGGGAASAVIADGVAWLVAAGGGGGGGHSSEQPVGGGGGGGGATSEVFSFPTGTHLTLAVGGGGRPGCDGVGGAGGEPEAGVPSGGCWSDPLPTFGGGEGHGQSCGAGQGSRYGGAGAGDAESRWGGGGGEPLVASLCANDSIFGGDSSCDPGTSGGGGGFGTGRGARLGATGASGAAGGRGGDGADPARAAGRGGDGGMGPCDAQPGRDGWARFEATAEEPWPCPADLVRACDGTCEDGRWWGDGWCDAAFDCPDAAFDSGDCPAGPGQLPDVLTQPCPTQTAESGFCVTTTTDGVEVVGLDSATSCLLVPTAGRSQISLGDLPPPYRELTYCSAPYLFYAEELGSGDLRGVWVECVRQDVDDLGRVALLGAGGVVTVYDSVDDVLALTGSSLSGTFTTGWISYHDGVVGQLADDGSRLARWDVATDSALPDVVLAVPVPNPLGLHVWAEGIVVLSERGPVFYDAVGQVTDLTPWGRRYVALECVRP